jgi:putative tricarboxylic transport membrane protein
LTETVHALPDGLEFVSQGHAGSGTHLMLTALAESLAEAGICEPPPISVGFELDGGEAIRMVAAGGPGTLGSCSPAYLTSPVVHEMSETWRDLTPVAQLVTDSYLLVAPAGTVRDALDLFSRPTTVVIPKSGGNTDIQAMLLGAATGTQVTVVVEHDPTLLRTMLDGDRAHWTTGVYSDFAAELAAGRLEVVATFDAARLAATEAPTLRDSGIDVIFPLWRGVIGPGDLSESIVSAWTEALQASLNQPAWSAYCRDQRQNTAYLAPTDFAELLAAEDQNYRRWLAALQR